MPSFRKRRVATPGFGHTPWNPMQGDQANLRQDGLSPFCAMMQIAEEDIYDDYVICRGFDPRILRFVNYAAGDPNKPGISVAKPFGKRRPGTYQIAEVYPAFLPTQGNPEFTDFRQTTYTPPSPIDVLWRVGQNPGVVVAGSGLEGGQPADLTEEIEILIDHNGKVVNWMLIDSNGGDGACIEGTLTALRTAGTTGPDAPYAGLIIGTVTVAGTSPSLSALIGEEVDVVDHSECVFDLEIADLDGVWVWATRKVFLSRDPAADPGELTPPHWSADDRCCVPADSA